MIRPRRLLLPVLCFALGLLSAGAQTKFIRLRQGIIATEKPVPAEAARAARSPEAALSGLILVQFEGPIQAEWREALRLKGVDLLHYVPDDAFVARGKAVQLGDLKQLSFVRWAGQFRPEHKLQSALAQRPAGEVAAVSVLLAPDVTPQDTLGARQSLQAVQHEAHFRFGTLLRGRATTEQLQTLAASDRVLWIEPAPKPKLYDEVAARIVAGDSPNPHRTTMMDLGYDGSGVTVAVADSGLHLGDTNNMHPDLAGRVTGLLFYGELTDASDEHSHGTHVAGIIAGNGATGETDELDYLYGLGVAPGANIVAQRIFDGLGNYVFTNTFASLTSDAKHAGADIGSNSWGDDTQGRYDTSAMEFDALVRDADPETGNDQPYILEFSAGNAGPGMQTIGSPAVAKNVIATGASENNRADFYIYTDGQETLADFSSRGPCEDGRIKPDVVAPGTWISSLRSPVGDDNNAWGDISYYYLYQGGTSQAGPHVSGAAAVFVQWYRVNVTNQVPSPALVKAALIHSAVDLNDGQTTTAPVPNNDEGWGQVDLTTIIGSPRTHEFLDQTVRLTTGQSYEKHIVVVSADEPLVVTLVYTDVPAFPGASPALVNDLDLEVVAPDGGVYRGNQFQDGESVPDALAADSLNNVEGVYVSEPQPGEYVVRVKARNVAQDAVSATKGVVDQDFALVVSALLPPPGLGVILLDRPAYRAPSQINLKVVDTDLAGQASVPVTIQSSTEPTPLTLTLKPSGAPGIFTGSVATVTGPAQNDGRLQIAHGDLITATYLDNGTPRLATAVADLLPPLLTSVVSTNEFGYTVITWLTDEPANGVVLYGTNTLNQQAANPSRTTDHRVTLPPVPVGQTNRYLVISTDAAGNTATNNNGGALFVFVGQPTATLLFVDDFVPASGDPDIPFSIYSDALAQVGVSFDYWNIEQKGRGPTSNEMRPYRVVWWRVNDSFNQGTSTLSPVQQNDLTKYVNGGGAFFMDSMEILSRVGPGAFTSNVLHVGRFVQNPLGPLDPCPTCYDEDHGVPSIESAGGDPISRGVSVDLDYSLHPFEDYEILIIGPDLSDTFGPTTNAMPIFAEVSSGWACGLAYPRTGLDATGRVVFLSFPFDAIPETGPEPNNRAVILRRILQFLVPGYGGFGTLALDREEYTAPDLMVIEVADQDLVGLPDVTVSCFSTSFSNAVPVTLRPTLQAGVLRGYLSLVPSASTPDPLRLRVNEGDTVYVHYLDESGAVTVEATATIDTVPPTITSVAVTPSYEDATITWETSELADALVQFGESTSFTNFPVNRTAYLDVLDLSHSLLLTGLTTNRTYYFRVISRDPAGNVSVDDNQGAFYSFRTLEPNATPYFDDFSTMDTNWTVFTDPESQSAWTLGVPNNGVETEAYSPPNAWGSNLNGDWHDTINTTLISPAIALPAGSKVTLRFWDSYDFQDRTGVDLWEYGQVFVLTNSQGPLIELATLEDVSGGWVEEEFDLTPYAGHVIILLWQHQLVSMDSAERPGWLVDDVSVTTADTIQITNNLSQAEFVLSGPLELTNGGNWTVIQDAPPGQYTVTFLPVAYYQTPAPQTGSLPSSTPLVFTGNYTFTDANHNGIPDSWEVQYTGTLPPNGWELRDDDHDGASNYDEFIAGTNPTNALSCLRLSATLSIAGTTAEVQWPTASGRSYRIVASQDLVQWTPWTDWQRASAAGVLSRTVPLPSNGLPRFLRLEVQP